MEFWGKLFSVFDIPCHIKNKQNTPAEVSRSSLGPTKFAGRFVVKCFHKNADPFENFVPCYLHHSLPTSALYVFWFTGNPGIMWKPYTWIRMEKVLGFKKKLLFNKVPIKIFHIVLCRNLLFCLNPLLFENKRLRSSL